MNASLREFEMAQIGNLAPATAEEAKMLIPRYIHKKWLISSLAGRVDDEELQKILDDLATIRRFGWFK